MHVFSPKWNFLRMLAKKPVSFASAFQLEKGVMCAVSVKVYPICLSCTQQESELKHLAIASVKLQRHLFTSRLCDTDGFELKIHRTLYLWPNLHCRIQLLESEITVLNLSISLPVISGNVNIVPRPWCVCLFRLTNTELCSVNLFSYVLLRINLRNQKNVIQWKELRAKTQGTWDFSAIKNSLSCGYNKGKMLEIP